MKINVNDHVRVKLTDHGRDIYRGKSEALRDMFARRGTTMEVKPKPEDADGYSRWQLWDLMETFGAHCGLGRPLPFEGEIQTEYRETTDLIPTEWCFKADTERHMQGVMIHRMTSPFYNGTMYAIRHHSRCLNHDNEWEYEPTPSSRDEDFYKRCRFEDFDDAVKRAREASREYELERK